MKSAILIVILFISIFESKAQSTLTLNQCIEYAINNNADVKIQECELTKCSLNLKQTNYSLLPSVNASYTQFVVA